MSFKARFYSFIYAENIDDHEHILVSFIPFANLLHVNQICWQNFISIVDNHAYWFVVVLSFVLSRYKELIKLSLKKNASPRLRDWRLVFTWQNQMQNTNSACDSVPYNSRFHVLLGIPRVNPNVQLHGVFSKTLTQLITLT